MAIISIIFLNTFTGVISGSCLIDEGFLLTFAMIATIIVHIHLLANIIIQFCDVLKIRAFVVKPEKYEKFSDTN